MIAAIDENNGLGYNNALLCHLPADLKQFKKITLGKPIIMGRKTFRSIGRPLPERENIVVSQQIKAEAGIVVKQSLTAALAYAKEAEDVFIIGGASLFAEALPFTEHLYLTRIHHCFIADVFFPTIDFSKWHCLEQSFKEQDEKNPYNMTFYHYQRVP